ncbi:MAG TPA: helix-turn-helix domain-containing protein [Candidatus Methylacidiphilales bacterium]|nr:helix-turn-helix domain-containing protein [Candidatus Methylacidiphilales bacterium]
MPLPAANASHPSLLSVPYAHRNETRFNSRYYWECMNRGSDAFVIVQLTHSGSGAVAVGKRRWEVPAGHALVAVVPEPLRYFYPPEARDPWTFSWINCYGVLAEQIGRRFRQQFGPVCPLPHGSPAEQAMREIIDAVIERRFVDPYEASEAAYGFWMKWWRQLDRARDTEGGAVQSVITYCRDHFREPIRIKDLAARAQLSREHLSRIFREKTGQPPAGYLRQRRAKAAGELLRRTSLPLKEIALRCGFQSERQCREAFQSEFGEAPQIYRKRAR